MFDRRDRDVGGLAARSGDPSTPQRAAAGGGAAVALRWRLRTALVGVTLAAVIVIVAFTELALRLWFPPVLVDTGIGYDYGPQAERFGWGFGPNQRVILSAPDTGEIWTDRTNSRGWRDRDHDLANSDSAFRVVVIGDSNTFGAAVPAEALYTRVLERILRRQGVRAEVISMGYGGWGTDQALEALQTEGVLFRPNVVVYQFSGNDLGENADNSPTLSREAASTGLDRRRLVPFGYDVDDDGRLVRTDRVRTITAYQRLKQVLQPSAIGMRLLLLKRSVFCETLAFQQPYHVDAGRRAYVSYAIQTVFPDGIGGMDPASCEDRIRELPDGFLSEEDLRAWLEEELPRATPQQAALVMRLLESQHIFHAPPSTPGQLPADHLHPDPSLAARWQLLRALVVRMRAISEDSGARLVVFPEWPNLALFKWEVYWFYHPDTPRSLELFLSPRTALCAMCRELGIPVVPSDREARYSRPRNDPHPGPAENRLMAEEIATFLEGNGYIPSEYRLGGSD